MAQEPSASYKKNCMNCHGIDGKANTAAATKMKIPSYAAGEVQNLTDEQLSIILNINEPEAIASYEDALKIDANMPEAHVGMAEALALTGVDAVSLASASTDISADLPAGIAGKPPP